MANGKMIKGVLVKENGDARIIKFKNVLEELQKLVGGWIETVYLNDRFVIVCNEEGKYECNPNRKGILYDKSGKPVDQIFGDFVIVAYDEDDFATLSNEDAEMFLAIYTLFV